MMKKLIYIFMLFFLFSCEKQTDWNLQDEDIDLIIINGTITDELKKQRINIFYPVKELNQQPKPVSGAIVRIVSNNIQVWLTEEPGNPGVYSTASAVSAIPEIYYRLIVQHKEKQYKADTYMKEGRDFQPLIYGKANGQNLYEIKYVTNEYNFSDPAIFELFLDWSHLPLYADSLPEKCKALMYFYALPSLDVNQIFAPSGEKVYFPKGTMIIEKRYSITQNHAAYIRDLLLETTWTGGIFNPIHANVEGNLSTGAMGYFAACGVVSDTIVVAY